jgi:hypothetical protein
MTQWRNESIELVERMPRSRWPGAKRHRLLTHRVTACAGRTEVGLKPVWSIIWNSRSQQTTVSSMNMLFSAKARLNEGVVPTLLVESCHQPLSLSLFHTIRPSTKSPLELPSSVPATPRT